MLKGSGESERIDNGGVGGAYKYAFMLHGRKYGLGFEKVGERYDRSCMACLLTMFFSIAVRGDTQRDGPVGLVGFVILRDDDDGAREGERSCDGM